MRDTLHLSQGISHRQTPLWQRDLASKMTDDRYFQYFSLPDCLSNSTAHVSKA